MGGSDCYMADLGLDLRRLWSTGETVREQL